jgi:hypothetical protein
MMSRLFWRLSGDVVDRVALQSEQIDDLERPNAHELFHLIGVIPLVIFHGVEHAHVVVHQLEHVFVARHNGDFDALLDRLFRESADDVVGLEAVVFDDGDAHGLESLADPGDLFK